MAKRGKSARVQVLLRVPETLRARVETAAKDAGNSMNAEIIERLTQSFETEDRLGGPGAVDLIETIANVMKSTGEQAGFFESGNLANQGQWLAMPYAFDQAMKAAITILEHYRPPGDVVAPAPRSPIVIGVGDTKVDRDESVRRMHEIFANLGKLMADSQIRTREQDDE